MAYAELLFAGVPKAPLRAYLATQVRKYKPARVVIPCTGSFALAAAARAGGLAPENIINGDISLYSSVLGAAVSGLPLALRAKGPGARVAEYLSDPVSTAAAVLYMLRWCQWSRKAKSGAVYWRDRLRDWECGRDDYIEDLRGQVESLATNLAGAGYQARNLWQTIAAHRDDAEAMIWLDPPWYAKGYARMFAGLEDCFDWNAPRVAQFDPAGTARLMGELAGVAARVYVLFPSDGSDPAKKFGTAPNSAESSCSPTDADQTGWRAVYGHHYGTGGGAGTVWALCNQPDAGGTSRVMSKVPDELYPIFDGEITKESHMWAQTVPTATADYYRDVFVHRLDGSLGDTFVALLLDGAIFAIIGLHLQALFAGIFGSFGRQAHVVFHFPAPSTRYKRLGKLMLLALCSTWFWRDLAKQYPRLELVGLPGLVQTTMLTARPASMLVRGTSFKLVARQPDAEHGFKLNYKGALLERTRAETLSLWLRKYAT